MKNLIILFLVFGISFLVYAILYGSWLNIVTGIGLILLNVIALYEHRKKNRQKPTIKRSNS
jgi:hypothetical protein